MGTLSHWWKESGLSDIDNYEIDIFCEVYLLSNIFFLASLI